MLTAKMLTAGFLLLLLDPTLALGGAAGLLRPRVHTVRARPAVAQLSLDELRDAVERAQTDAKSQVQTLQAVAVFLPLVAFAAGAFMFNGAAPDQLIPPRAPSAVVVDAAAVEARVQKWEAEVEASARAQVAATRPTPVAATQATAPAAPPVLAVEAPAAAPPALAVEAPKPVVVAVAPEVRTADTW